MLRRNVRAIVMAMGTVTLLLAVQPASAAEDPLDAFPANTSVVVRLKNPKALLQKAEALADKVQPGAGLQLQVAQAVLGQMISNPTLEGVKMDADWWLGVFLSAKGEPVIVFAIPAEDADAMKDVLPEDINFITHEEWAIYTDNSETADVIKAQLEEDEDSIRESVEEQSLEVLDKGDISVFLNVAAVREVYGTQIEAVKEQLPIILENLPQDNAVPGVDPKAILESIDQALFQALEDAESWSLALSVEKNGIRYEDYLQVEAESATSEFFKERPGKSLTSLSGLPAGEGLYVGFDSELTKMATLWSMDIASASLDDDDKKAELDAVREQYEELKLGEVILSMSVGDNQTGAMRTVGAFQTAEAKKFGTLIGKILEIQSGIELAGVKTVNVVKPAAEKYGTIAADIFQVKQEYTDDADPNMAAIQEKVAKIIHGPDGMTFRTVYLKDRLLQTMGGGKASMTRALDIAQGKTKPDAKLLAAQSSTRKQLSEKANLLVLIDLAGITAKALSLATTIEDAPELPVDKSALDAIGKNSSYLGYSLSMEPTGLRSRTFVPVEQMQSISKLVGLLVPAFMSQR